MTGRLIDELFEAEHTPSVELIGERTCRARFNYICDVCGCGIHRGDRYQRHFFTVEDCSRVQTSRTHIECPHTYEDQP